VGKIDKNKTVVIDSSSVVDRLNIPSEIAVWQKKRKKVPTTVFVDSLLWQEVCFYSVFKI
jgi:hypothetical protein